MRESPDWDKWMTTPDFSFIALQIENISFFLGENFFMLQAIHKFVVRFFRFCRSQIQCGPESYTRGLAFAG